MRYERWTRTNRLGSRLDSSSASVCGFRYSLPFARRPDVVVLRDRVVELGQRDHDARCAPCRTHDPLHACAPAVRPRRTISGTGSRWPRVRTRARAARSAGRRTRSGADRLQQVVDRVHLERAHRAYSSNAVDEHDRHVAADRAPAPRSRIELRHLDVQEHEVGRQLRDRLHRLEAVAGTGPRSRRPASRARYSREDQRAQGPRRPRSATAQRARGAAWRGGRRRLRVAHLQPRAHRAGPPTSSDTFA